MEITVTVLCSVRKKAEEEYCPKTVLVGFHDLDFLAPSEEAATNLATAMLQVKGYTDFVIDKVIIPELPTLKKS